MNRNLLILSAGQYGLVAKETAEAMGCFEKIAFLDDENETAIGWLDEYEDFVTDYNYAFVAIGNSELRLSLIQKLEEACYRMAILVHPKAYISPSSQLQKGCIVEPNAVIQANSVLSIGVIVSAGAVINHNCFIGDVCHIDAGAVVKSNSILKIGTKVESGTVFSKTNITDVMNSNYSFEVGM
jgi:UDP-3-O-[3-hydroxymyristoyl] glucosamine N-acyltransferase